MSCYILGAVWVENLFWKAAGGVDVCLETRRSFPWSGTQRLRGPLRGNAAVPSLAGCRATAGTVKTNRAPLWSHPNTFLIQILNYGIVVLFLCNTGRKSRRPLGRAGGCVARRAAATAVLGLSAALGRFQPGLLLGWKLHLPKGSFAFYTRHFKGFHVVLNSWTRTYNPLIILASLLEGSVIGDGMWSLLQSDQLKNIWFASVFWIFLQQAAFPCFSSLLSCM